MRLLAGEVHISNARLGIAIVDRALIGPPGDRIIRRLQPFFPHIGVMLVAVGDNGFVAHAPFHTSTILALLQLEEIEFKEIDLTAPPIVEKPLPF